MGRELICGNILIYCYNLLLSELPPKPAYPWNLPHLSLLLLQLWALWGGARCFLNWYLHKMKSSSRVEMSGSSSLFPEFLTAPAAQAALPSAGGKLGGWGWWGGRQKPCSSSSQGGFPSTNGWKVQWEVKDAVPWQCRGIYLCYFLSLVRFFLPQMPRLTWCFVMLLSLSTRIHLYDELAGGFPRSMYAFCWISLGWS